MTIVRYDVDSTVVGNLEPMIASADGDYVTYADHVKAMGALEDQYAEIVEAAVKDERERCAKIAEACKSAAANNIPWERAQRAIARAIRQEPQ